MVLSLTHTRLPKFTYIWNKTITPEVIGRVKKSWEIRMEASNRGGSKPRARSGSLCTYQSGFHAALHERMK